MRKNYLLSEIYFKKNQCYRFGIIIFLLLSGLFFAQNKKLDRKFQYLLDNKVQYKTSSRFREIIPNAYKLETKAVKTSDNKTTDLYSCIIYTDNVIALKEKGINIQSVYPKFVTALVSIEDVEKLQTAQEVIFVESPKSLSIQNDIAVGASGASLLHAGMVNNTPLRGKGILVGIFDTGIDWDHPDFRDPIDPTKSRILRIWDQTLTPTGSEISPTGFSYGVEYTQTQINGELSGSTNGVVREADLHGHGTHVAGTAVGNGAALSTKKYLGMAPEADIVVVKGGDGSFPTSNTIDSFTYFKNIADLFKRPIVLNYSIGGQYGPHDGTRPDELAADSFVNSGKGRLVVVSAGNDNGKNLHKRLNLAPGETQNIIFNSPASTTAEDIFGFRLYLNDNTNITSTATAPNGEFLIAVPGQDNIKKVIGDSFTMYLEDNIETINGDRFIDYYIARNGTNTQTTAGAWTLSITNNGTSAIVIDGWLYYKNSAVNTTIVGSDNDMLVSSPGNATDVITAASYVGRNGWYSNSSTAPGGYTSASSTQDAISTFSAIGPRRDGLQKPDIAAVGQAVISAMSTGTLAASSTDIVDATYYRKNQGTSMSAPVITGALALMLQAKPNIDYAEAKNALHNTAQFDISTGAIPNNTWGYGKLDIFRAVSSLIECSTQERKTYLYETPYQPSRDGETIFASGNKVAVKFTPNITGKLGGINFATSTTFKTITSFTIEILQNNGGVPGNVIATKSINPNAISKYSWQYFDLSDLNIDVTSGNDYFLAITAFGGDWSLRRESTNIDNRSYISTSGGTNWTLNSTYDYRIRSIVYSSSAPKNTIASTYSSDAKVITDSNPYYFSNKCELISKITPNGATPIKGLISQKIWIEDTQINDYVKRHYEITPSENASNSTAKITLYFTQQEFTDFNNNVSGDKLPTSSNDTNGIANLRIRKYSGSTSDGSGLPESYLSAATIINPNDEDIVWNTENNYWEVTFDTSGFSGFFVSTPQTTLSTIQTPKSTISIYPNPAIDIININGITRDTEANVYDLSGKIIKSIFLNNGKKIINISSLAKGIYVIKFKNGNVEISRKFIKK